MDYEKEINNLRRDLDSLTGKFTSFVGQYGKNQVNISDDTKATRKQVSDITPYTETKTAYIYDTTLTFENVPDGNLTIYFNKPYSVSRENGFVILDFDPLTEVTDITISVL